ncbi:uncharacterized protein TNCV_4525191 [Trichonephila clavipes]|nr:uncharacterized protein TNCV_4525191 [Trichonephila clavipes]
MTSCNHMCCHSCNDSQEPFFQRDNARSHTARVSYDCLCTVTTLTWLARSPDLSLIEYIWDHLGRRVGHPTSLNELEARRGFLALKEKEQRHTLASVEINRLVETCRVSSLPPTPLGSRERGVGLLQVYRSNSSLSLSQKRDFFLNKASTTLLGSAFLRTPFLVKLLNERNMPAKCQVCWSNCTGDLVMNE